MYMSQHRFTPVPEKFEQWLPYNWNYMTLTARVKGAVLSRILRINSEPESFFAIGLWTDKEAAIRWSESDESKLGAKPSVDQGLYDRYPMEWSRWNLADFTWGLAGSCDADDPELFVRHIVWDIAPDLGSAQENLCRAALSLLARRPGFVCGETYRSHREDRLLLIHTYRSAEDWPFGGEALPDELQMLKDFASAQSIGERTSDPVALDCTAHQVVWGPDVDALQVFMEDRTA